MSTNKRPKEWNEMRVTTEGNFSNNQQSHSIKYKFSLVLRISFKRKKSYDYSLQLNKIICKIRRSTLTKKMKQMRNKL